VRGTLGFRLPHGLTPPAGGREAKSDPTREGSDPLTGTPRRGEGYGQETREGNLQKSERL